MKWVLNNVDEWAYDDVPYNGYTEINSDTGVIERSKRNNT